MPLGSPGESIFPGIRANISGFVDIFSGGALTQDSTSFDYKASAVKVLRAHTISFGGEFERDRIDADDYSYTPGDNTFNGERTAAPTGATLPAEPPRAALPWPISIWDWTLSSTRTTDVSFISV